MLMSVSSSTSENNKKFIQTFGWKIWRRETNLKSYEWVEWY
jgi:hypothetical protein